MALKTKEERSVFTLTKAPILMRMGEINNLSEICKAEIIATDAIGVEDIENLYTKSMAVLS